MPRCRRGSSGSGATVRNQISCRAAPLSSPPQRAGSTGRSGIKFSNAGAGGTSGSEFSNIFTKPVAVVLSKAKWNTAPTDIIEFEGRVSAANMQLHTRGGPDDQGAIFFKADGAKTAFTGLLGRIAQDKTASMTLETKLSHVSALRGRNWEAAVKGWSAAGGQITFDPDQMLLRHGRVFHATSNDGIVGVLHQLTQGDDRRATTEVDHGACPVEDDGLQGAAGAGGGGHGFSLGCDEVSGDGREA